jgi:hypothetical protein
MRDYGLLLAIENTAETSIDMPEYGLTCYDLLLARN